MYIDHSFPPNFDAIDKRFGITKNNYHPIFAYYPAIFNPYRTLIGPELVAHEEVHGMRQRGDPAQWWERYLIDDDFRLVEEMFAHIAEYEVIATGWPRQHRRRLQDHIVRRLCFPMYGYQPPLLAHRAQTMFRWALRERGRAHLQLVE